MRSCCQLLEAGVLEVGGERLEQLGVGDDVAADFFGGADRDVLVAVDDRFARAALEREDRDEAVGEQRQYRRAAQQEGEPGRDVPDARRHQCWLARGASVTGLHSRRVAKISRPGSVRRDDEALAHRPGAERPGEKNRRRVVDDGLLNARHGLRVFLVV